MNIKYIGKPPPRNCRIIQQLQKFVEAIFGVLIPSLTPLPSWKLTKKNPRTLMLGKWLEHLLLKTVPFLGSIYHLYTTYSPCQMGDYIYHLPPNPGNRSETPNRTVFFGHWTVCGFCWFGPRCVKPGKCWATLSSTQPLTALVTCFFSADLCGKRWFVGGSGRFVSLEIWCYWRYDTLKPPICSMDGSMVIFTKQPFFPRRKDLEAPSWNNQGTKSAVSGSRDVLGGSW